VKLNEDKMPAYLSPKYSNIARPYAAAAFEYAKEKKELAHWKNFLDGAAEISSLPDVLNLLEDPEISSDKIFALFSETLALNSAQKNFLHLLTKNRRLAILPQIAELFNLSYESFEKTSNVRVITATRIDDDYRQKLTQVLAKRIQRTVALNCEVDPKILGGAIIHIGDRVIDGSIRGKLSRLLEFSLR
jgi:F-type H+-transporting ATPase subunit delta